MADTSNVVELQNQRPAYAEDVAQTQRRTYAYWMMRLDRNTISSWSRVTETLLKEHAGHTT